ncbi:transglycosylase domain-containing protein [Pseudobacteroides cellulosolvens]|uniref:Penicillin-binding protein 1A n=1 Tax=Pseudobacteroides cellulosolvens ATCC 35603 = DSM 2933 TaxID=398512 RepID=A0A0L6JMU2_9FIRM|nr:PBP1A family penicillin-binding protein [Pseudobacteroides cellulosolvens]KNY27131.1 penicillin-binding protein, 1A family [Pseudobacteroides cellulosolvens ATCC 35603 = DSM 2933]
MDPKTKAVTGSSTRTKKRHGQLFIFITTVLKILFISLLLVSFAAAGILGGLIFGYIKTTTPIKPEQLDLKNITSFVYDSKGNEIMQLKGEQNRILVEHDSIPDNLRNALISIEDKRFYDHKGIDLIRISSAVFNFLKPGGNMHGGSTITQQLVKNITGDTRRTLKRKVQEQYMAIQLEKHLSKEKILDLYMNLIYMGGNYYGVETASQVYFGKSVKDLTLAQCASLAGITNLPGIYAPVSEKNIKKNIERQKNILFEMKRSGSITEQQYQQALKEDLKFVASDKNKIKTVKTQSFFVDQVIIDVKKDLIASGMSPQLADKTIYSNGIKIYSTMDPDIQKGMDEVFTNDKYFPIIKRNLQHPQAAMVIMDPSTGQVKALYGGYGQKTGDLILNRATQIQRQPGSTFKPIADYAPAIDMKLITAASVFDDAPSYLNPASKSPYPTNYTKGYYSGLTTIHTALYQSINVVAAKTWLKLGSSLSLKYLARNGINLNKENDGNLSIAMGGLHEGVNTLKMAAAYVPFVNDGVYRDPITYTKVLDKDGNVLLEKKSKSTMVYDNEGTAFIMTRMMQDVCRIGTASTKGLGLIQKGKIATAGKTGTTSDNRDKWFVGYTPYYVGATWYGYDKNSKLSPEEYNQALIIWHEVMEKAHANLKPKEFKQSTAVIKRTVCRYSGKTPSDLCARDPRGNAVIEEYFLPGTEPKSGDTCDVHVTKQVCKDSKDGFGRNNLFGPGCPQSSLIESVFVQRKVPYNKARAADPYPSDWKYEAPVSYCTIHGGPPSNSTTNEPVNTTDTNSGENNTTDNTNTTNNTDTTTDTINAIEQNQPQQ